MSIFFIFKVVISSFFFNDHVRPPITLISYLEWLTIFEHVLLFECNVFLCMFLIRKLTTHHSHLGVQLREVIELVILTSLILCKTKALCFDTHESECMLLHCGVLSTQPRSDVQECEPLGCMKIEN